MKNAYIRLLEIFRRNSVSFTLVILIIILVSVPLMEMPDTPRGFIIGVPLTASVSIVSQSESLIFEDNGAESKDDFTFQIGPMNADDNWYSYNGTYGGVKSSYDSGLGSDGMTQTFSIKNMGTATVDVTIAAADFDNGTRDDGNYIDVDQSVGNFQIYIPGAGWRYVPDNNDKDDDNSKEIEELCVADDLMINESVAGIDFRLRAPAGLQEGNYTGSVVFIAYDSTKLNPCSGVGVYAIP